MFAGAFQIRMIARPSAGWPHGAMFKTFSNVGRFKNTYDSLWIVPVEEVKRLMASV